MYFYFNVRDECDYFFRVIILWVKIGEGIMVER